MDDGGYTAEASSENMMIEYLRLKVSNCKQRMLNSDECAHIAVSLFVFL